MENLYSSEIVSEILKEELANMMDISKDEIAKTSTLEEFDADSLDYLHFINKVEKRLKIDLPKKDIFMHLANRGVSMDDYIDDSGLKVKGVELLKNSLNKFNDDQLEVGMNIENIYSVATLENWTNLCMSILNSTSEECGSCNQSARKLDDAGNIRCSECNEVYEPMAGDLVLEKHLDTIL